MSSPDAEGVGAVRVSLPTDEEDPSLIDTSSITGLGTPENSSRMMLPEVPDESPGAVTENVALLTPPQLERANQP